MKRSSRRGCETSPRLARSAGRQLSRSHIQLRPPCERQSIGVDDAQRQRAGPACVGPYFVSKERVHDRNVVSPRLESGAAKARDQLFQRVEGAMILAKPGEAPPPDGLEDDVRPLVGRLDQVDASWAEHSMDFSEMGIAVGDMLEDVEAHGHLE